jgi:hypothetical protein
MTWKSLLFAVFFGAAASVVFGAPSVEIVRAGTHSSNRLDANGDWVWSVGIRPSVPTPVGSLNAEIGFAEVAPNNRVLSATKYSTGPGDDFYIDNPGEVIFGWETTQDIDPGPDVDLKAFGLQVNTDADQVFSALGSQEYGAPHTINSRNYIQIKVQGPCVDPYNTPGSSCAAGDRLTTTMQWLGAYDGNGRINERNPNPPPPTVNYDIYSGLFSYTAIPGDMNLDGSVDGLDYKFIFNDGPGWGEGDFNGDGSIDGVDYNIWLFSPGAGSGAGADSGSSAVPEPASVALATTVMLAFTLAARRR